METREVALQQRPERRAESFDAFYLREFPAMVAIAAAVSGSRLAAEDIAQEAMVRAHRSWAKVGSYDKPGAWARRVTINLATSVVRRATLDLRARSRMAASDASPIPREPESDRGVWEAVGRLPGKQRAAIALHYLEDRSVAEIAEILGCSPSTAKVHLHRGRTRLASLLDERNER